MVYEIPFFLNKIYIFFLLVYSEELFQNFTITLIVPQAFSKCEVLKSDKMLKKLFHMRNGTHCYLSKHSIFFLLLL